MPASRMRWTQYWHFSITPRKRTVTFGFCAICTATGMSLGQVTSLHNNPAVLSTCAILSSTLVMTAGVLVSRVSLRAARRRVAGWGKREHQVL